VRKQNCSSIRQAHCNAFASFGFERWLPDGTGLAVGLQMCCNVGGVSFFFFCGGK